MTAKAALAALSKGIGSLLLLLLFFMQTLSAFDPAASM
jgi:hypothetical protein